MSQEFWQIVAQQVKELESAKNSGAVLRILSNERNPLGPGVSSGDGFFAGSGGDDSVESALMTAGWTHVFRDASYYWVMKAPDGSMITYIEGDIYNGNRANRAN